MVVIDRVGSKDLVIENLHYSYGGKSSIFKGLEFNIQPGEFFCGDKYADPRSLVMYISNVLHIGYKWPFLKLKGRITKII